MNRTVIRLEEAVDQAGDVQVNFRPEEPVDVPERQRWRILGCDPAGGPFSNLAAVAPGDRQPLANDLVRVVGEAIHAALVQHPGVAQALDRAAGAPAGARHPIRLLTTAFGAEALPWEALHHPQAQFVGLDPRFALQRAIQFGGTDVVVRTHTAPLRMTAVLAAADRDARGEWEALRDSIEASALDVALSLFVIDDALEQLVTDEQKDWVTLTRVPPTRAELLAALERARPQLLHVYSHGSADGGGFIEIATPGTATFGDPPLYLEARHLSTLRDELWLVTLDACEGATPAGGVHSLAYTLVDSGVPAAIGMREMIDSADANVFCRAFYTNVLTTLAGQLLPGTRVEVEWATGVSVAREALCGPGPAAATAATQKRWTLPVLYAHAGQFHVETPTPGMDTERQQRLIAELDVFRRALTNLHPDNPPLVRQQLEAEIARREAELGGG